MWRAWCVVALFLPAVVLLCTLAGGAVSSSSSDSSSGTCDKDGGCPGAAGAQGDDAASPATTGASKYCVVGAGPAGVQLGHLLNRAGYDYTIFERGYRAGTFFNKYPVHRMLNSFNRRNTRTRHGEFNLRHDWHTLLEHDDVPRFPNWTKEFWPQADVYVEYLNAYQQEQKDADKIRYCNYVTSIVRDGTGYTLEAKAQGVCDASTGWDGINNTAMGTVHHTHTCSVLIMADGMWKPTEPEKDDKPWVIGTDLTIGYDSLRGVSNDEFEDKKVLILGGGNAAYETADAIRNYASDIVIFGRAFPSLLRHSKYVGSVRGPRTMTLDMGQIKSLEGAVDSPNSLVDNRDGTELFPMPTWAILPCGHSAAFTGWPGYKEGGLDKASTGFRGLPPRCVFERNPEDLSLVLLGWADRDHELIRRGTDLFGAAFLLKPCPKWLENWYEYVITSEKPFIDNEHLSFKTPTNDTARWTVAMMDYKALRAMDLTTAQLDLLAEMTAMGKGLMRRSYELDKSYDVVIQSLGWQYETAPFDAGGHKVELMDRVSFIDDNIKLQGFQCDRRRHNVYPKLSATHEAVGSDNLYFVGANTHGLDRWRYKASGGFIHGFRYTTRFVFRTLESRYEGKVRGGTATYPVPPTTLEARTNTNPTMHDLVGSGELWAKLLGRVMFSAASYEMLGGALVDGIVLKPASWDDSCEANQFSTKTGKACTKAEALYIEEITEDMFHANYSTYPRITYSFHTGGTVEGTGGVHHTKVRFPEYAPTADPFHPVIEYWPIFEAPGVQHHPKGDIPGGDRLHPASYWPPSRKSHRFHFKADRLTDYSNFAQVPLLDAFLRDVISTVGKKDGKNPKMRLKKPYHEAFDTHKKPGDEGFEYE